MYRTYLKIYINISIISNNNLRTKNYYKLGFLGSTATFQRKNSSINYTQISTNNMLYLYLYAQVSKSITT